VKIIDKILKSPYLAILITTLLLTAYFSISYLFRLKLGHFDIEATGITDALTYLFYGFAVGVISNYKNDFIYTNNLKTYYALYFLCVVAILREMGIQYWLTTTDTVVTKLRFFTNPNNLLHEKIIAGLLMLIVLIIILWIVFKYIKNFLKELLNQKPIPFTIITFIALAIITQIVDRIPANYTKTTGITLSDNILFIIKILEEGGESILPLLFAPAFWQYNIEIEQRKDL